MSPSGFSSGAISSRFRGGFLFTLAVGFGSPMGVAKASCTGPRAWTSTPCGTLDPGEVWPGTGTLKVAACSCDRVSERPKQQRAQKPTTTINRAKYRRMAAASVGEEWENRPQRNFDGPDAAFSGSVSRCPGEIGLQSLHPSRTALFVIPFAIIASLQLTAPCQSLSWKE